MLVMDLDHVTLPERRPVYTPDTSQRCSICINKQPSVLLRHLHVPISTRAFGMGFTDEHLAWWSSDVDKVSTTESECSTDCVISVCR